MNIKYNLFMFVAFIVIAFVYIVDTFYLDKQKVSTLKQKTDVLATKKYSIEIYIFVIALLILFLLNGNKHIFFNNYSYLADSLLHGHLDSPNLPSYLESVEFGGYKYVHFAPCPAILCMPFVAIWGVEKFNAGYLCMFLGALNCVLFYRLITNLKIGTTLRDRLWFTAFAVFGVVHLFLAAVAHSWFFGHISTWFFLLLSMCLITSENNKKTTYILSGIFFGMAVACRLSNLIGAIFFIGYIFIYKPEKIKGIILFGCGAAIPGGLYMLYNFVRFGTILDKSYNLTHLKDYFRDRYDVLQGISGKKAQLAYLSAAEKEVGGPLQTQFIKYNLYSLFLMPPEFSAEYPYIIPSIRGVSITFLSPALYFFICVNWKNKFTWVLASTMVLASIPFLMNYGNGMAQFGMRYAMDFLPYMILLACMGMKSVNRVKTFIISYCILANVWGPIYWRFFYLQ